MWLEELVWVWGPVVAGFGLWGAWSLISLKAEVNALRERVIQLENQNEKRYTTTQQVA
jgi:hypothetical protein